MNITRNRRQRCVFLGIIFGVLFLISFMQTSTINQNYNIYDSNFNINGFTDNKNVKSNAIYYDYYTKEWLDNGNFTAGTDPWYNETEGDDTDVQASYSDGAANYETLGDNGTFSIIASPPSSSNWKAFRNPDFPLFPNGRYDENQINNGYGIDNEGCWATHEYDERVNQTDNFPCVHWKRNVNMPVNMSDYEITSASLSAYFNATVRTNLEVFGDNLAPDSGYAGVWDWVRFYVLISDLDNLNEYRVANYKTTDLGSGNAARESLGSEYLMGDTAMIPVDEETLIFYLTSVLNRDYRNFTITLGIHIYCEDNYPEYDWDTLEKLLIKNFSLSISYEKRIDPDTSLSWTQVGKKIPSGNNVEITNAEVNFKYKINETWSSLLSPNSEIRILINDSRNPETIRLSDVSTSFQEANMDLTSLVKSIGKGVNISLSIQVYLADEFSLDKHIKVSIDNVSLEITYSVSTEEDITTIDLFLEQENKTLPKYIDFYRGDPLNIIVHYKNSTNGHIIDATVNLTGTGPDKELDEDKALGHYSITIDTIDFPYGENYFKVIAQKKYFESQEISFTVDLKKRSSYIDKVFLNNSEDIYIEIPWNELIYINVTYNDTSTNDFIDDATVKLVKAGFEMNFSESNQNQYNLTLNSTKLALDRNSFSITAEKENYTSAEESITIVVTERETSLDVSVDNMDTDSFLTYNASIGQYLNITVKYKDDLANDFIKNADVNLYVDGGPTPNPLLLHPLHSDQYNITILTDDLGKGYSFIEIIAEKANHTSISEDITIIIEERATNFDLLVNGTQPLKTFVVELEERINITVFFEDNLTTDFLNKANVTLTGYINLTKHPDYNQYNATILGSDLKNQGFNYLSVFAYKENYKSHSETFIVQVVERSTSVELYFDGNNVTLEPTITLPIGKSILITIKYVDKNNVSIEGATIRLIRNSQYIPLNWNPATKDYNYTLNTNLLGIGNKLIPLVSEKTNYQTVSRDLSINVRKIHTDISTEDGKSKVEIKPGENAKISIEIENLDFGRKVKGCDVTYDWKEGDGDLEEVEDGVYEFELENVPEGTYTITIFVYKEGGDYEFEEYEITLVVKRSEEDVWPLYLALMIIGVTALILGIYIPLNRKYFNIPPPIRRLRKYRKTLNKDNDPNVKVISFNSAIASQYEKAKKMVDKIAKGAERGELLEEGVEFAEKGK